MNNTEFPDNQKRLAEKCLGQMAVGVSGLTIK